jgi:F-type H+-transporting ATPase subunit gamma
MSGTIESLTRKISGAADLEAVVRSMKALAASSIGQYQKAVHSLDEYASTVELALTACLRQAGTGYDTAETGAQKKHGIGAIVFGSDQGLVGRFNEVVVEFAVKTLKVLPGTITKIWPLGERIHALLGDTGMPTAGILPVPDSVNAISGLVAQILIDVETAREHGDVVEVYLFHNHPKSGSLYEPIGKRLLPLDLAWQKQLAAAPWPTNLPPEVIQGTTSPLRAFIREYLFVLLFQACAESLASENASRLAAVQRAEKNIDGILEDLNLKLHRMRQESIDEELFDVISGYEALTAVRRPR